MKKNFALICIAIIGMSFWSLAQFEGECGQSGCHDTLLQGRSVHSAAADDCSMCHEVTDADSHEFKLADDEPALCFMCHDEDEVTAGKNRHMALESGCTACHDPHAGKGEHLLKSGDGGSVCFDCHSEFTSEFVHGPAAVASCTACHVPHASDRRALQRQAQPDLCFRCHGPLAAERKQAKHIHYPVEDGCTECHSPHDAPREYLLAKGVPELCVTCHDDKLPGDGTAVASVHEIIRRDRSCVACHSPHFSPNRGLLAKASPELCFSCHDREITTGRGTIRDIATAVRQAQYAHDPVTSGCDGCHEPHFSVNGRLLTGRNATDYYVSYSEDAFGLCFQCHDAAAFTSEKVIAETGFRDSNRNLHFVHVNKERKGRNCFFCHDVHGAAHEHLIRDTVRFGTWDLPLNYQATPTGGACTPGCHKMFRYENRPAEEEL